MAKETSRVHVKFTRAELCSISKIACLLVMSLPELMTGAERGQESSGRMGPLGNISFPLAQSTEEHSTE